MARLVNGTVTFPKGTPTFKNAWMRVMLEDVGMMDAPATIVAEETFAGIAYQGLPLTFTLDGAELSAGGSHSVRIHISMTSDDQISKGDYITKQSYPVNTTPADLTIAVEVV